ncbi:MAG: hypothetical protein E3J72_04595 [Planctomycetota bacterium]|nr:MAG: hypothetical protein E3J72_04595 [Planctomycetota bacterium]
MEEDEWGPLGPIIQSPDDLMDIPIEALVFKLATRLRRLRLLEEFKLATDSYRCKIVRCLIRRERALIRVAEIAARARVRELAMLIYRLGTAPPR